VHTRVDPGQRVRERSAGQCAPRHRVARERIRGESGHFNRPICRGSKRCAGRRLS
jgi:hypothetical protein